jgi:hypothetical protein
VALTPGRRLEVEQAAQFIAELDDRIEGASPPRLAYLIGLAAGHLESVLDVVRAVTQ